MLLTTHHGLRSLCHRIHEQVGVSGNDNLGPRRGCDQKVRELKNAGEAAFQQAKADVEGRIAEFEESVKTIESKIKAA